MKISAIPKEHAQRGFWIRWRRSTDRGWSELLCNDEADLRREFRIQRTCLRAWKTAEIECYRGELRLHLVEVSP